MPFALRKRGKVWHARGTIPARQADGSIVRIRHEESLRTQSKADAQRKLSDLDRYYHDLAYNPKPRSGPTFAEAAITYLNTKQKGDRFLGKLIEHFGEVPIEGIDQARVSEAAHALYPLGSASTHNRAVFDPVSAVLRMSGTFPNFRRPRVSRTVRRVPEDGWFDAVLPHCSPSLAALITFLTLTGRRISEAIALTEKDLDGNTVHIAKTKTGVPVTLELPSLCRDFLDDARRDIRSGPGFRPSNRLFGYSTKENAHRALRRICDLHGIPYYSSHQFGRHAFATRLLKAGWSVKHVARAGGWKSPMMVLKVYGHLEHDEVQSELGKVNEEWSKKRTS